MASIYSKEHLDVVFEERNKEYGAYVIRQKYEKQVFVAFLIALGILLTAVAMPYISALLNSLSTEVDVAENVEVELMDAPPLEEDVLPPPPPVPPPPVIDMVKFTPPVVVDKPVVEEEIVTQEETKETNVGTITQEGDKDLEVLPDASGPVEAAPEQIFQIVEQMPEYPGGMEALYKFLQNNMKYPEMAKAAGISGKVYLQFVVEADGSLTDVKALRTLGGGCTEEAIRVVKLTKGWKAGRQNGKAVRVQYTLPVNFSLK